MKSERPCGVCGEGEILVPGVGTACRCTAWEKLQVYIELSERKAAFHRAFVGVLVNERTAERAAGVRVDADA